MELLTEQQEAELLDYLKVDEQLLFESLYVDPELLSKAITPQDKR